MAAKNELKTLDELEYSDKQFIQRMTEYKEGACFEKQENFKNFLREDIVDKLSQECIDNSLKILTYNPKVGTIGKGNQTTIWKPERFRIVSKKGPAMDLKEI